MPARAAQRYSPVKLGEYAPSSVFNLFTLSASVSYALDLFGGERRMVEALHAQVNVPACHRTGHLSHADRQHRQYDGRRAPRTAPRSKPPGELIELAARSRCRWPQVQCSAGTAAVLELF